MTLTINSPYEQTHSACYYEWTIISFACVSGYIFVWVEKLFLNYRSNIQEVFSNVLRFFSQACTSSNKLGTL